MRYVAAVALALILGGCEAQFRDLNPEDTTSGDTAGDSSGPMGSTDSGIATDGRSDVSEPDGSPDDAGGGGPRVVAEGPLKPRDYSASGRARLYRLSDGSWEVRFEGNFQVESTPGPFVYITSRKTMGSSIKPPKDKELGELRSNSGDDQKSDRYTVSGGPGNRRVVFIYCKPFGAEIARAILESP